MGHFLSMHQAPLIEFKDVTVFRNDRIILNAVNLIIDEGENVAILGPNGAGKSSLIKTINREYYPVLEGNEVTFKIRGSPVWDVFELRSTIGIVSNDLQYAFTRDITGNEVILSGFFSSIGLFNREISCEMQKKADEILEFLEIGHLKHRKMTTLSSGEARRLLIGRALVNKPKTLILDEPTNSLDLHALHTFRTLLRKITQSGTGIILVTHNLYDIIPEITRIILINDGRICGDGSKEKILNDETIRKMFRVPVTIHFENGYYYATGF